MSSGLAQQRILFCLLVSVDNQAGSSSIAKAGILGDWVDYDVYHLP